MQTTPRHVLAASNGIVNLPEYILTNSHFQLEKNEVLIQYSVLAILSVENSIYFAPLKESLRGAILFGARSIEKV